MRPLLLGLLLFVTCSSSAQSYSPDSAYIFLDRSEIDSISQFYDIPVFDSLVTAHGGVLSGLDIVIDNGEGEVLYQQSAFHGSTTLHRKSYGVYRLDEYWIMSLDDHDFFGQVHLFTFDADLNTGKIMADKSVMPAIRIWKGHFPEVMATFDSLEVYERAHPTNWEQVTEKQWADTETIASRLMLCAINGCEPCGQRLKKLRKVCAYIDAAPTLSQTVYTYEEIVFRYDQIQGKRPQLKNWTQPYRPD